MISLKALIGLSWSLSDPVSLFTKKSFQKTDQQKLNSLSGAAGPKPWHKLMFFS